jgi:hypothetical protein
MAAVAAAEAASEEEGGVKEEDTMLLLEYSVCVKEIRCDVNCIRNEVPRKNDTELPMEKII